MDFANLVNLGNMLGFPGGSDGKESSCSAGDPGSNSGSGRSPGEGNGNPLQYSCHGHVSLAGYSPWGSQRVGHDWKTNAFTLQEIRFPKSSSPDGSGLALADVEDTGVRFGGGSEGTAITGGKSLQSETMADRCQSGSSFVLSSLFHIQLFVLTPAWRQLQTYQRWLLLLRGGDTEATAPHRPLPEASSHLRSRPPGHTLPFVHRHQYFRRLLRDSVSLCSPVQTLSQLLPHFFNF